jgi:hypothetical protein
VSDPDPRIGTVVAGSRIERRLRPGGMSVVYVAEHLHLERKVALKVLDTRLAGDEDYRKRFIRESRLAAGLYHPNIVPIYDAGEAGPVIEWISASIALDFISAAKHRVLIRAAVHRMTGKVVVSHTSGLVLHDLPTWNHDLSRVHVTRDRQGKDEAGVKYHSGDLAREDIDTVDDIEVTGPTRTIIDTA